MSQVFAAWVIAPAIAGAFSIILFSITKYGVLKHQDPLRAGLWMIPLYFGVTSGILTMVIVWKGGESGRRFLTISHGVLILCSPFSSA